MWAALLPPVQIEQIFNLCGRYRQKLSKEVICFNGGKWGNCLNDYKNWMVGDLLGIWRHKTSFLPWNDCWRNLTQQGQWVMMINRKDSACYFSKCFWKVTKEEKVLLVLRAKKWKVISDKMGGKIFQFMGSQKQHPIHRKKMNTCHNYLD